MEKNFFHFADDSKKPFFYKVLTNGQSDEC